MNRGESWAAWERYEAFERAGTTHPKKPVIKIRQRRAMTYISTRSRAVNELEKGFRSD